MATKRAKAADLVSQDMESRNLPTKGQELPTETSQEPQDDPLVTFSIRLPRSQKAALQAYFKREEGLDLGPGIRSLLTKFQREKRI